jgi:hypothetical protein
VGCCGLDAFEFAAKHMAPWFREQRLADGLRALTQLESLVTSISRHRGEVWSDDDDLNAVWPTAEQCLDFLDVWFREAVQALATVAPQLVNPSWHVWNGGSIPKLAQSIYTDRAFDRLPILADALEEAGCDNADILEHCRSGGEHVRGCWVLDLILRKDG